jgi:gas vesicle protein
MFRFLVGVGVGAAIVYFLDAERGEARRTRTNAWVRQYVNPDTIEQARQTTVKQARSISQQVSQQAGAVGDRVSQYRASRRDDGSDTTLSDAVGARDNATSRAKI